MSEADVVEYHWSETNGKKYRRGSRQFKKADVGIEPTPAAKTPDVPWKWEEDGMTVIRGTARSAPGCHNVCGILSYVKDGKLVKVEGDPEDPYNQGRLCSRCLCIPDYVYHEDRLLYPMKRKREDGGKDKKLREQFDFASARAVAHLRELAEYCLPYVKVGGYFISLKGPEVEQEIREAKNAVATMGGRVEQVLHFSLPDDSGRSIVLIKKISHTPPSFPRTAAKMAKKPIL